MAPESAGQKIESPIVAAYLIAAKENPVGVADEKLASALAALADLADHPSGGAAIQIEIRISIEHPLQSPQILGVAAHVGPDPGQVFGMPRQRFLPHPIVIISFAEFSHIGGV